MFVAVQIIMQANRYFLISSHTLAAFKENAIRDSLLDKWWAEMNWFSQESVGSTQKVVTREEGVEKHWIFPSSTFKCLQTSPSQGWQAHLHAHLRIITLLCTCRQMGAAAAHLSVCNWHIYLTTHTEFKWHSRTWDASWGTLTHTGRLYARYNMCAGLPPDNSPEIWESNWAQIAGFDCHVGVSSPTCWRWVAGVCGHCTVQASSLRSTSWVSPLLPPHPHRYHKCASLLFREFISGRVRSSTTHRNSNKAPLLIFWGSDPVLFFFPGGGVTAIHLNPNKQQICSIITPKNFPRAKQVMLDSWISYKIAS